MEVRLHLNTYGKFWLSLCAVLALGSVIGWFVPAPLWDWQPGLAASQPWRWWTAAFVHWSEHHMLANLLGLAVVAALGRVAQVPGVITMAWLATWPLVHLCLLAQPALAHYGGLSGMLHAGVAIVATFVAATRTVTARGVALAMLVGLIVKVLSEAPWSGPLLQVSGWDIAVAPLAHASGVLLGIVMALLVLARDGHIGRRADETHPVSNLSELSDARGAANAPAADAADQGRGNTSTTSNQLDQNRGLR